MRYTTYYVMAYLVSITFAHFPVKVSLGLPLYIMQSVEKKPERKDRYSHNSGAKSCQFSCIFLISDFQVQAWDIFPQQTLQWQSMKSVRNALRFCKLFNH